MEWNGMEWNGIERYNTYSHDIVLYLVQDYAIVLSCRDSVATVPLHGLRDSVATVLYQSPLVSRLSG